jgi:hypothetical protein
VDLRPFIPAAPNVEDCWRGVVLYGRNTASYKFALASALLEINPRAGQLVKLDELAPVYSKNIARHLKDAPKQITTTTGKFLKACQDFNVDGELDKLVDVTVAHGFANVIDAFHIVGQNPVHHRFFIDERKFSGGIRITDEFAQLSESMQAGNVELEVEARWRLVETAWNLEIAPSILCVKLDDSTGQLFAQDRMRRRNITSCRDALNGYQKGHCFYCGAVLALSGEHMNVDVDHFFPHRLKAMDLGVYIDGIWNLVLACSDCNRGTDGKFGSIPSLRLLERLHARNEYLIGSHHPLRETLIQQTGRTITDRAGFLNLTYQRVQLSPLHGWEPREMVDGFAA